VVEAVQDRLLEAGVLAQVAVGGNEAKH
jgi:hypothetical protein